MSHERLKQDSVRAVLQSLGVSYTEPNESLFRFALGGLPSCLIRVRDQGVVFYVVHQNKVDVSHRKAMAEYIIRVNFALNFGNFEFNFADGQIRFKMSVQAAQASDIAAPLKSCLTLAQDVYPRWVPGFALVQQGTSPDDAYRTCKTAMLPLTTGATISSQPNVAELQALRDVIRGMDRAY